MCTPPFAAALTARMGQTAEVLRPTDNKDRYGAFSADKDLIIHRYLCRVLRDGSPQAPSVTGEKSVVRSDWRILLPADSEIRPDDIIRVDGQIYEVLDSDSGRAGASFITVYCRRAS
jgi:hypothetical protein